MDYKADKRKAKSIGLRGVGKLTERLHELRGLLKHIMELITAVVAEPAQKQLQTVIEHELAVTMEAVQDCSTYMANQLTEKQSQLPPLVAAVVWEPLCEAAELDAEGLLKKAKSKESKAFKVVWDEYLELEAAIDKHRCNLWEGLHDTPEYKADSETYQNELQRAQPCRVMTVAFQVAQALFKPGVDDATRKNLVLGAKVVADNVVLPPKLSMVLTAKVKSYES